MIIFVSWLDYLLVFLVLLVVFLAGACTGLELWEHKWG